LLKPVTDLRGGFFAALAEPEDRRQLAVQIDLQLSRDRRQHHLVDEGADRLARRLAGLRVTQLPSSLILFS
jgi:hypothetical protein